MELDLRAAIRLANNCGHEGQGAPTCARGTAFLEGRGNDNR